MKGARLSSLLLVSAVALAAPATAGTASRRAVPILMYHVVQAPPAHAPNPGLFVSKPEFAAQMRWLARQGYRAVTLTQVYDAWHGRGRLPRKPVVVSFDDGYRSQYTHALPVLRARGWSAVLNLDLSNTSQIWGLRPPLVRALARAGWEIDAHSLTHADLRLLHGAALRREIAGSRRAIQRRFGQPARFFCYPAGLYDAHVIAAVRAAGFLGATTVRFGLARAASPYTLDRVRMSRGDGVAGLRSKLAALGRG